MVVVFDSKPGPNNEKSEAQELEEKSTIPTLEFVNNYESNKSDKEVRKRIRSHVMKTQHRNKRGRNLETALCQMKDAEKSIAKSLFEHPFSVAGYGLKTNINLPRGLSGSMDPFIRFPIQMEPHMYKLVHHCEYTFFTTPFHSFSQWVIMGPQQPQCTARSM
jgi:hypothetical protein